MSKKVLHEIVINQDWCKGCRICVHFCPKDVLAMNDSEKAYVAHPDQCICCQLCEFRCPELAIEVNFDES